MLRDFTKRSDRDGAVTLLRIVSIFDLRCRGVKELTPV
jgi:hypothetical protein